MVLISGKVSTMGEAAMLPNLPEFDLPPMNINSGTTKALLGQGAWLGGHKKHIIHSNDLHLVDTADAHNEGKLGIPGNLVVTLLASLTPQPEDHNFKFKSKVPGAEAIQVPKLLGRSVQQPNAESTM